LDVFDKKNIQKTNLKMIKTYFGCFCEEHEVSKFQN